MVTAIQFLDFMIDHPQATMAQVLEAWVQLPEAEQAKVKEAFRLTVEEVV